MPNAAPYIARPARRLIAGALDLWVCLIVVLFVWGMTTYISWPPGYIALALHNKMIFVAYGAYHAICFWLLQGATPGLYFLGIRVVSASGGTGLSLLQVLARAGFRPAFLYASWWLSSLAALPPGADTPLFIAPLVVELGMMFSLPSRQTLSDLVSKTLVVNVPPPQPHRAPAAPMYSPSDAEFGLRPGKRN